MEVSNPYLPGHIQENVKKIIEALYASDFAEQNVDLEIVYVGILNYTTGVKLRLSFVDAVEDHDIEEWSRIARKYQACDIKTRLNTSSGNIDINIEYKRRVVSATNQWWIRSALLVLASYSFHQLHLLNPERYPWFE
jgi:hypothetical protein|tara:strand:+ start:104 stop:514 length:411 start_codon:yes stop_codon:yes gene_type:complete